MWTIYDAVNSGAGDYRVIYVESHDKVGKLNNDQRLVTKIDSGDPSKPDRFASTTSGRLPLAAVTARAVFRDACGNSVPEVHAGGPSAGTNPRRGTGCIDRSGS